MAALGWYSALSRLERRTFLAAFGGLALDSMDTTMYALVTPTLIAVLGISRPEAGLLATVNLVGSAVGGWFAGMAADRFGRIRVLQATILIVAVSTFAAAFAEGFWYLFVARAIQGVGYGGEAAVGAVLVAEVVAPALRGRVASAIQSGYALGNAVSVALLPVIFATVTRDPGWRILFAIGLVPAVCVFFVRRFVPESGLFVEEMAAQRANGVAPPGPWTIFGPAYIRRTVVATLFTTGTFGAAYVLITWLPTYVQSVLKLQLSQTAGYLGVNILGSFCGPLIFGLLADRIGRRRSFMLFLVLQALNVVVYTQAPVGPAATVALGFFLGAFQGGLASGLMPTFSELFPTDIRANGAGFALSAGRGFGSVLPALVGLLSVELPLGDAMAACACASYAAAFLAALFLPEASGVDLRSLATAREQARSGDMVAHPRGGGSRP